MATKVKITTTDRKTGKKTTSAKTLKPVSKKEYKSSSGKMMKTSTPRKTTNSKSSAVVTKKVGYNKKAPVKTNNSSVIRLGYGPINQKTLDEKVASGEVKKVVKNNTATYGRTKPTSNTGITPKSLSSGASASAIKSSTGKAQKTSTTRKKYY